MSTIDHREQIARARASIGRALALMQDHADLWCSAQASERLAAAVRNLFTAERAAAADPSLVGQAMDALRAALGTMQDACADRKELEAATAAIARALAVLFPLLAELRAELTEDAPLPLVHRSPAGPEELPIPLAQRAAPRPSSDAPLPLTARKPAPRPAPERRVAARRDVQAEIGIQSETYFYTGFACDISSGGLFVATYDLPAVGAEVNVNFRLPGGPMMSLGGTVRWVRDLNPADPEMAPGMGVAFDALPEEARRAINAYLAEHPPIFYET